MKKIVMAVAAIAMAGSMFAVEFTGALKIGSSIVKFEQGSKPTFLEMSGLANGGMWYDSRAQAAVWLDRAGMQFCYVPGGADWVAYRLWFEPAPNVFKVNLGTKNVYHVNAGVDWWMTINEVEYTGFAFEVKPVDGLEIDFAAKTCNPYGENKVVVVKDDVPAVDTQYNKPAYRPWIDLNAGEAKVYDTALFAKYSAEGIGNIGFGAIYNAETGWSNISATNFKFSLGYGNKFGEIDLFADVAATLDFGAKKFANKNTDKEKFDGVFRELAADVYANIPLDSLGFLVYVKYVNDFTKKDFNAANTLCAFVRGTYSFGGPSVYLEIGNNGTDYIAKDFSMVITPGVKFDVGACNLEAKAEINIGKKFSMNIPLTAAVNF